MSAHIREAALAFQKWSGCALHYVTESPAHKSAPSRGAGGMLPRKILMFKTSEIAI